MGLTELSSNHSWAFPLNYVQVRFAFATACKCGAEDQTVDHKISKWALHCPSCKINNLTSLDKTTIVGLQKICPKN